MGKQLLTGEPPGQNGGWVAGALGLQVSPERAWPGGIFLISSHLTFTFEFVGGEAETNRVPLYWEFHLALERLSWS